MERTRYFLLISLGFIVINCFGQNNKAIYRAYIHGDMEMWEQVMDSIELTQNINNKSKLELINYQYGCIAYCIEKDEEGEAELYLLKAKKYLKQLEQDNYRLSMLYAYKSAFVGFEIGLSPYKAPFIGAESLSYAEKSVGLDAENAFGYVQLGNIAFYTPGILGGSKKEALNHYLKALMLMEKTPLQLINNWNYANLLATIINAYFELEQYGMAQQYCKKALRIEPEFDWVKNNLYPKVLKQLNNE